MPYLTPSHRPLNVYPPTHAQGMLPSNGVPDATRTDSWRRCADCGGTFTEKRTFTRHLKSDKHRKAAGQPLLRHAICDACGEGFTREHDVERHKREGRCHPEETREQRQANFKRTLDNVDEPKEEQILWKPFAQEKDVVLQHYSARPLPDPPKGQSAASQGAQRFSSTINGDGEDILPTILPRSHNLSHVNDGATSAVEYNRYIRPETPLNGLNDWRWVDELSGDYTLMDLDLLQGESAVVADLVEDLPEDITTVLSQSTSPSSKSRLSPPPSGVTTHGLGNPGVHLPTSRMLLSRIVHSMRNIPPKPVLLGSATRPPSAAIQISLPRRDAQRQNVTLLRHHLDEYLARVKAESAWPTCGVSQVSFIHEQDLQHHRRIANYERCCALGPDHDGPCTGHLCGFNFAHNEPCRGHHPPGGAADVDWSDHDRFKFGQFLRKWELSQLRMLLTENGRAIQMDAASSRRSILSVPELRFLRGLSRASIVGSIKSGRTAWSEPIYVDTQRFSTCEGDIAGQFEQLGLSVPEEMQQNARELSAMQAAVAEELHSAVLRQDVKETLALIRRGARADSALALAIERRSGRMTELLIRAVSAVPAEALCLAVLTRNVEAAETLLAHCSAKELMKQYGSALLQAAIRNDCVAMVEAMLTHDADPDSYPTHRRISMLIDLMKSAGHGHRSGPTPPGHMPRLSEYADTWAKSLTNAPPLYVAASLGHCDIITSLMRGGADTAARHRSASALGMAIIGEHRRSVEALLSAPKHVDFSSCWQDFNALELAVSLGQRERPCGHFVLIAGRFRMGIAVTGSRSMNACSRLRKAWRCTRFLSLEECNSVLAMFKASYPATGRLPFPESLARVPARSWNDARLSFAFCSAQVSS